jgi:hypothetical protein
MVSSLLQSGDPTMPDHKLLVFFLARIATGVISAVGSGCVDEVEDEWFVSLEQRPR